jgi:hypothetical protein
LTATDAAICDDDSTGDSGPAADFSSATHAAPLGEDGGFVVFARRVSARAAWGAPRFGLDGAAPPKEVAMLHSGTPSEWAPNCLVHTGCAVAPIPLHRCPADQPDEEWSEVLPSAASHAGKELSVRGRLGVGQMASTAVGCGRGALHGCCNYPTGPVVLAGPKKPLILEGLNCTGDESQICCNAPAYGQSVVATGTLEKNIDEVSSSRSPWRLSNPKLCATDERASNP